MKASRKVMLLVVISAVALFAACSYAQGQSGKQGQGGPMMRCQERFESMDKNGDGAVTHDEFTASKHLRANPDEVFQARDANGDGSLTRDEFCSGRGRGMGRGMGGGRAQ